MLMSSNDREYKLKFLFIGFKINIHMYVYNIFNTMCIVYIIRLYWYSKHLIYFMHVYVWIYYTFK